MLVSASCLGIGVADSWSAVGSKVEASPGEVIFVDSLQGLLTARCAPCHGDDPAEMEGGLDVRTRQSLLLGGDSAMPALVPGEPEESPMFLAATRAHEEWKPMPPKDNDRLSQREVDALRNWITAGAPWPEGERLVELKAAREAVWSSADGQRVQTSGGLSEEWTQRRYAPENLWAYQPLCEVEFSEEERGEHPVDALVNRRLEALGLTAAPRADRLTLIRRATFDLTGLPPTPEAVRAFVDDPADDKTAFARLVEQLLGSPHYGEKMARHWLDVSRYADSAGYANDYARANAWRYRDYVVRAFNEDKPYDQFVREQLAGDELAEAMARARLGLADDVEFVLRDPTPEESALIVATGFLRMGPWELTGMEVAKVARQRYLDDVTDIVGQTFLGHMLQCARCHDHKFDPVPTRDYYSMQAVFATTQIAERRAAFQDDEIKVDPARQQLLEEQRRSHLEVMRRLDRKSLDAAQAWFTENDVDPGSWFETLREIREEWAGGGDDERSIFAEARRRLTADGVAEDQFPPKLYGFSPEDYGRERIARKGLERLSWELDRDRPYAHAVYGGLTAERKAVYRPVRLPKQPFSDGELEQVAILAGGDPFSPGQRVSPGALSVVDYFVDGSPSSALPDTLTGRRLALANWIVHPQNPLTARVMVNRIWQWHFDRAIAANANNFGATGKKPSHPELLDWLASAFVDGGWSIKEIHRLIMTSDAYQRSAAHPDPERLAKADPEGSSWAVFAPRRLTAEELRDAMLAVTGELDLSLGGPPVRPEMNLEAALQPRQVMGTFAEAWQPSPRPEQRHRRSLYALKIRGQPDPFLEVFNCPSADLSSEKREASSVTPQVFSLFNSESSYNRAIAFANRLLEETSDSEAVVRRAVALAFGRVAEPDEVAWCSAHWRAMETRHESLSFTATEYPTEVVREAVEENTGEKFTFVERLAVYEDFVPDLHASDVDARTRALAEVCLVLLNSNEFSYVY